MPAWVSKALFVVGVMAAVKFAKQLPGVGPVVSIIV